MHKHVGANRRRRHGEKRRAAGRAMGKAASGLLRYAKFAVIALLVCGGGIVAAVKLVPWVNRSSLFTVKTIVVDGCVRVDKAEAVRLIGIAPGMRMTQVKPAAVRQALERMPWVRRAHVARRFPSTVAIRIEERQPIALVNCGRVKYLDADGVMLPLFAATYSNLPVVSGFWPDSAGRLSETALCRVKQFLADCEASNASAAKRISQADFSLPRTVRITLEDAPAVIEINEAQTAELLRRLQQIVQGEQNAARGLPKRINLCYENLAYLQW
ncbi:MAG TPA: FtsQ-type POTRA domain-containing protein [Chitinivibrionales bacterium]|nr:FtsQ-type POTRA domain-containing protein [Chitinivibrionales bacterium]